MGGCANDNSNKSARLYMLKWIGGMIAIPMGLMTVFFLMTFGRGCGEYREPDRIIEKTDEKRGFTMTPNGSVSRVTMNR